MRTRWPTLALSLLFAGCFDAHGGGHDVDAGVLCELRDASVIELACPTLVTAAEDATVAITTSPVACCASGTVRTSVRTTGASHTVELEWDACECCEGCRCVGPIQDVAVSLGLLSPGRHTVLAGGQSCTFEVVAPPPPGECGPPSAATDFRAPAHLFDDQPYPTTLTSEPASGCSCSPRVTGADTLDYSLELCDCCEACECIDPGYQASAVRPPLPIGAHSIVFPHGAGDVTVHAREECHPIDATAITIVPPRRDLILGGPALTWARVDGEQWLCCASPQPIVEQVETSGPGIALQLSSCVQEDCDCVPTAPTPASAWFALGELAPGTYSVRVGDVERSFTVE